MGYTGPYSLGARCGTEAMATGLMIFLGEGCLANELLSKTKGQGMGFGWTAFGFGFAFFVSLAIWNGVSAYMSPSFVMGLWVIGEVSTGRSPSGECLSCHVSTSLKMISFAQTPDDLGNQGHSAFQGLSSFCACIHAWSWLHPTL